MNKIEKYRKILEEFVNQESQYQDPLEDFQTIALIDKNHNHYQVLVHGFRSIQRFYTIQYHFEIIGEKVWIQRDITDSQVQEKLIQKGIPKVDIILGYLPEISRYLDGYGIEVPQAVSA